jgi:capsular exopolysaccharide synthesis family protein
MKTKNSVNSLICLHQPKSPVAELFRTLRTNIQFAGVNKVIQTLMVTSASLGEGKSTVIANLAVTTAQSGKRVLLIDADLRKPTQHQIFQIPNGSGLTHLLIKQAQVEQVIHPIGDLWLDVIPSGPVPPNPADLLGSQRMKELLEQLRQEYDMILIDAPPVLAVTDPQLLATFVDGVLLVIRAGKVKREDAKKAMTLLDYVEANVIGSVFNYKKMDSITYY